MWYWNKIIIHLMFNAYLVLSLWTCLLHQATISYKMFWKDNTRCLNIYIFTYILHSFTYLLTYLIIHLTLIPFVFDIHYNYMKILLYTITIKHCTTGCFSEQILWFLFMLSRIHRTHPKINNENKLVKYDTKHYTITYFAIFQVVRYSIIHYKCHLINETIY